MSTVHRWKQAFAVFAFTAVALLAASASPAWADSEPNDNILQAEGPLSGGSTYGGTVSTTNDDDWYAFFATSQTQLKIYVSSDAEYFALRDEDGDEIESVSYGGAITYTTPPGTHRFYIEIDGGQGSYGFNVNPDGGSLVSGAIPRFGTPTGEPNEFATQAAGPLGGGLPYTGSIDTSNDEDWFYFYALPNSPIDVSLTGVDGYAEGHVGTTGTGDSGDDDQSLDASDNHVSHARFTSPPAITKYYVEVGQYGSGGYQLQVDPASSVTLSPTAPAPAPRPAPARANAKAVRCASARSSKIKFGHRVHKYKVLLRQTHSRRRRAIYHRRLLRSQRAYGRAKKGIRRFC